MITSLDVRRRNKPYQRCQLFIVGGQVLQCLSEGSPKEPDFGLQNGDLVPQLTQALMHASNDLDGLGRGQAMQLHVGQEPVGGMAATKVDHPVVDTGSRSK